MKNIQFHFKLLTRWLNFYFFAFELPTRGWKIKNFTSSYSMGVFLFSHFRVTNMKLINVKNSLNKLQFERHEPSILLLGFPRTAQACSKVGVTWIWSPTDGNLSYLFLRGYIPFRSKAFKFKNLKIQLSATYNNGRVVKY